MNKIKINSPVSANTNESNARGMARERQLVNNSYALKHQLQHFDPKESEAVSLIFGYIMSVHPFY